MSSMTLTGRFSEALGRSHDRGNVAQRRIAPIALRGASYTLMVLRLADVGRGDFLARLQAKISQAPSFFAGAPVLLDLNGTSGGSADDFKELMQQLRSLGLVPVGVQGGDEAQQNAAGKSGLAIFPSWRARGREATEIEPLVERTATPAPVQRQPMIIERPVRSGTRIYAEATDLVVLAPVSAGSELLADGSIHVYGALRGRALAGVSGDRQSRIFCRRLEAELVSIAGVHRVSEEIADFALGLPAQVRLEGDALRIETMD